MASDLWRLVQIMIDSAIEEFVLTPDDKRSSTTEDSNEQTSKYDQPSNTDRQFCFIIFNNPKWSHILRRHREKIAQQRAQTVTSDPSTAKRNEEKKELSLDDRFTAQLRQLFDDYMQHTKRRYPIKYFIDFTE
ncbi:hypothetical protein I4U23_000016 [Adineta vaga]|nr:hypothetical protein I4U23_000016 [Adineta vaga]